MHKVTTTKSPVYSDDAVADSGELSFVGMKKKKKKPVSFHTDHMMLSESFELRQHPWYDNVNFMVPCDFRWRLMKMEILEKTLMVTTLEFVCMVLFVEE